MGLDYRFERVVTLPYAYIEFGNLRADGNPELLPTYSKRDDCKRYTEKVQGIADLFGSK